MQGHTGVLTQEQERVWTVLDKVTIAYRGASMR